MAGDCLEVSVCFMEHATSMTKLSSCWLSESQQTLSHHVLMRTNDLRGLPYSEAGRAGLSRFGRTIALKSVTFVVESKRWKKSIQDGPGLLEGILCCTSNVKANCTHQSLFSGGAWHLGYSKLCQSLVFKTKFDTLAKDQTKNDQQVIAFPTIWPFHVDLEIRSRNNEKMAIRDGWSLFEGILCCTSGFKANDEKMAIRAGPGLLEGILCCTSDVKANCTHQSHFSGGAWHLGYSKLCQSLQ